jgi:acyl-CoA synthetase (NDP forming)
VRRKGVKALVVISAGFSESGNAELEEALIAEVERWGMRVMGPNCAGIINTSNKLYASIESRISPGKIAFVTQSGALGGAVLAWAENEGIGFSKFASYGNASDVDESDLISHLESDEATKVITLYVEGVNDGRKFYEATKRVARIKPVIVMKGGLSGAGSRAVQSHTGSLAGNSAIYRTPFKQAGVTYANTIEDMFDMAKALIFQGRVSGGRVVVLTNSGGPAVMVADELEEHPGQDRPRLRPQRERAADTGPQRRPRVGGWERSLRRAGAGHRHGVLLHRGERLGHRIRRRTPVKQRPKRALGDITLGSCSMFARAIYMWEKKGSSDFKWHESRYYCPLTIQR